MSEDLICSLGYLCLGSRLKRIGEKLQGDVQRLLDEAGLPLASGQCPLLAALDRAGPMPVGALVQAMGVSQPGVTRSLKRLQQNGLIEIGPHGDDARQRIVSLTDKGQECIDELRQNIWPAIDQAAASLCAPDEAQFLSLLTRIETGLTTRPLDTRARDLLVGVPA